MIPVLNRSAELQSQAFKYGKKIFGIGIESFKYNLIVKF
jgi:hypothetical protein